MWKQKLEAIKFLWKRKHFEERKLEAEANLEATNFIRSWKRKQKIFYCFHIPGFNHRAFKIIRGIKVKNLKEKKQKKIIIKIMKSKIS